MRCADPVCLDFDGDRIPQWQIIRYLYHGVYQDDLLLKFIVYRFGDGDILLLRLGKAAVDLLGNGESGKMVAW
ncbi:hypothetical protein [Nodularia chucula]|uniref:hypothetical protein n=1 Tax=Nodularia chucula TaxID=3093667 RepID=UPI0039C73B31